MLNKLLLTTEDKFFILFFIISLSIFAIVLIFYFIFQYPKDKAKYEERKQKFYEECKKEPQYLFQEAKVLAKRIVFYYKGVKLPELVEEYHVSFIIEGGEEKEFCVRQEVYEQIQEGQTGTLVTVNGNFFDFGEGEDIPPEMMEETEKAVEE